ncbi:hypothetical protein [Flavobacterium sp. LAR06]|uniref:hypothetical protein n=1 Tax=Flavobacterium sp. LAR06 TaxID=3064897 RepID=UPI0035C00F03
MTRLDIQKLIKVKKADTFWNHFVYAFATNYKVNGEVKKNIIKIWQKRTLRGIYYPVFTFEFDNQNQLVKITDKLNSYGKVIQSIFPFVFFLPLIYTGLTDFELKRFFICGVIILVLFLAISLLNNKIYQYEKKEHLEEFRKTLNIKEEEKAPEKEWSMKMILTRLFIYPICFAFILLTIFLIIPEGGFFISIPILGIVGAYLYSDLKLIFKHKKTENNSNRII